MFTSLTFRKKRSRVEKNGGATNLGAKPNLAKPFQGKAQVQRSTQSEDLLSKDSSTGIRGKVAQSPLDSGTAVEGDKHKNGKDVSFLGSIPNEYAAKGPMDMINT